MFNRFFVYFSTFKGGTDQRFWILNTVLEGYSTFTSPVLSILWTYPWTNPSIYIYVAMRVKNWNGRSWSDRELNFHAIGSIWPPPQSAKIKNKK